ncbi:hypothetical protein HAX54_036869, partial [Datura stramonium]|nr:hypothetical protein [Datura stramonium]
QAETGSINVRQADEPADCRGAIDTQGNVLGTDDYRLFTICFWRNADGMPVLFNNGFRPLIRSRVTSTVRGSKRLATLSPVDGLLFQFTVNHWRVGGSTQIPSGSSP